MSQKYDVEKFCADLKAVVVGNINTKLLAIDAEKNDGIVLKPIDADAYFFQELNGKVANYDPYLLYSIEDMGSSGHGPMTSQAPVIHFIIVLADTGQDVNGIAARMLRYQRALKEVFEEHWSENGNAIKIEISSMVPVQFTLMNSANPFRAIGVAVTGQIG